MSQYLPHGGFKQLNWRKIDRLDANSISKNSLTGYILEADLEYPDELHELHNDYPLAPENKINSKHTVKLRSSSDKFRYQFKQLAVPYKIYPDLKCNLDKYSY